MGKLGYILHEIDDRVLSWEGERCEMTADAAIDTYEDTVWLWRSLRFV